MNARCGWPLVAVVLGLATLVAAANGASGSATPAEPAPMNAPPLEPASEGEGAGGDGASAQVFVETISKLDTRYATLAIEDPSGVPAAQPIRLTCTVQSHVYDKDTDLTLEVREGDFKVLQDASLVLHLTPGKHEAAFRIPPNTLGPGNYEATLTLRADETRELANLVAKIGVISPHDIRSAVTQAENTLRQLDAHVSGLASQGYRFPYAEARLEIAKAAAPLTKSLLEAGRLQRAAGMSDYLNGLVETVRGRLTFGERDDEFQRRPRASLNNISIRNGAFYADGRPIFLVGAAGGAEHAGELTGLTRYGFNFTLPSYAPRAGQGAEFVQDLTDINARATVQPLSSQAQARNMAVSMLVSLEQGAAFPRAADWMPNSVTLLPYPQDIGGEQLGTFLAAAADNLDGTPMLNSLCIAHKPVIRYRGEDARQAFIAYARSVYPNRHSLNRSWKTRLTSFDEIEILPSHSQEMYMFDWYLFQRLASTRYFENIAQHIRSGAPDIPLYVKANETLFDSSRTDSGLDYAALADIMDISGVSLAASVTHPKYALNHPDHILPYILFRSFAPNQPVINAEHRFEVPPDHHPRDTYRFVRSVMWDSAIEGLNASAAWFWGGDDDSGGEPQFKPSPGVLEGLAVSTLDLNRLGEIVVAFQQAPAEIGVLWSFSSRVHEGGQEYMESLRNACEGIAFGGRKFRFLTEEQCTTGELDDINVLVLPNIWAVSDDAFNAIEDYIQRGGAVIRTPNHIPFDGRGHHRSNVLTSTLETILVRRGDLATNYMDALETAQSTGLLEQVPVAVNEYGYILEGIKTRYAEHNGGEYMFLLNIRKRPVACHISGRYAGGQELISGKEVTLPMRLEPLTPMLVKLEQGEESQVVVAQPIAEEGERKPGGSPISRKGAELDRDALPK